MKAVIYHADAPKLWDAPEGLYPRLFEGFKKQAKKFGVQTIHLTLTGFEGYGDETIFYDCLEAKNIVFNREHCFARFLEDAPPDVYAFMEPDARIVAPIPELKGDMALLYRFPSGPHFTPSFRMAKKTAVPVFREMLENMDGKRPDWHGDSDAFAKLYEDMGSPTKFGTIDYKGLKVEIRNYDDYTRKDSKIVTHHKFVSKAFL